MDTTAAVAGLRSFARDCARDGGALWGRSLCGPLAPVGRKSRLSIANQADSALIKALSP